MPQKATDAAPDTTEAPAAAPAPAPADSGESTAPAPTEAVNVLAPTKKIDAADSSDPSVSWTVQQGGIIPSDPNPYGQVIRASELPDPASQRLVGIDPVAWLGIGHIEVADLPEDHAEHGISNSFGP